MILDIQDIRDLRLFVALLRKRLFVVSGFRTICSTHGFERQILISKHVKYSYRIYQLLVIEVNMRCQYILNI